MIVGADFLSLGGKLAAYKSGEPEWRTSVSRAYYGALELPLLWQPGTTK